MFTNRGIRIAYLYTERSRVQKITMRKECCHVARFLLLDCDEKFAMCTTAEEFDGSLNVRLILFIWSD